MMLSICRYADAQCPPYVGVGPQGAPPFRNVRIWHMLKLFWPCGLSFGLVQCQYQKHGAAKQQAPERRTKAQKIHARSRGKKGKNTSLNVVAVFEYAHKASGKGAD